VITCPHRRKKGGYGDLLRGSSEPAKYIDSAIVQAVDVDDK
jgi:hypothetical protein